VLPPLGRSRRTRLNRCCQSSGYLSSRGPANSADIVASFRSGLKDAGYIDGENVRIESRFADGAFDKLPELAAELVHRQVNVLVVTGGTVSVVKAKPVVPSSNGERSSNR
jgi:ABC-type uncharacterized transport system substrate-binding protein